MNKDAKDAIAFAMFTIFMYVGVPIVVLEPEQYAWFELFGYGILTFLMCLIYSMIPLSNLDKKFYLWELLTATVLAWVIFTFIETPPGEILAYGKYSTLRFTAGVWMMTTVLMGLLILLGSIFLLISCYIIKIKEKRKK